MFTHLSERSIAQTVSVTQHTVNETANDENVSLSIRQKLDVQMKSINLVPIEIYDQITDNFRWK